MIDVARAIFHSFRGFGGEVGLGEDLGNHRGFFDGGILGHQAISLETAGCVHSDHAFEQLDPTPEGSCESRRWWTLSLSKRNHLFGEYASGGCLRNMIPMTIGSLIVLEYALANWCRWRAKKPWGSFTPALGKTWVGC